MAQKSNQKLRIGIVGAGNIVKTRHLPALKKNPDVDIVAASKRFPELVTMLCPPPFGMRADLLIKKLLAENFVGKPHDIRLQSFTGVYLNPEAPAHWRQKIEISGLNILTLGIYVEVMQRWLGDITGVFARGKILNVERRGYQVIGPDMLNVICVFENGAEGVLEFSGVHAGAPNDRLRIFGDRGALLYDFTNEHVRSVKYGGREMEDLDVPKELVTDWRGEDG